MKIKLYTQLTVLHRVLDLNNNVTRFNSLRVMDYSTRNRICALGIVTNKVISYLITLDLMQNYFNIY